MSRRSQWTGWIRRAGKGRWHAVSSGRTEREAYARAERLRYGSAPWRDYSMCEWCSLAAGQTPGGLFRRHAGGR